MDFVLRSSLFLFSGVYLSKDNTSPIELFCSCSILWGKRFTMAAPRSIEFDQNVLIVLNGFVNSRISKNLNVNIVGIEGHSITSFVVF